MATKTKLNKIVDADEYLICEVVKSKEGDFILSAKKNVLEIARMYRDKLMLLRNIPLDIENISPRDPHIKYIEKNMPWLKTVKQKVDYLRGYYTIAQRDAWEDAIVLSMFTDPSNEFKNDPSPYKHEAAGIPGLEEDADIPKPVKNLQAPIEKRLKQIIDIIDRNEKAFEPVMERINDTVSKFNDEESDEDGRATP